MKLSISNIAWGNDDMPGHLAFLKSLGVDGVELAPSLFWSEPVDIEPIKRREMARMIQDAGLAMVGIHALLFTRPELTVFGPKNGLTRDYLCRLAEVCRDLGGKTMVFGSGRNRSRGTMSTEQAAEACVDFFRSIAEGCAGAGTYFLIEPLPAHEADFIETSDEGAALVRRVGHPHFRLELDARAIAETDRDYSAYSRHKNLVMHVQTSDPGLACPGSTGLDHAPIGAALRKAGYGGFVSIEMRRDPKDTRGAIERAVSYVRRHYLEPDTSLV